MSKEITEYCSTAKGYICLVDRYLIFLTSHHSNFPSSICEPFSLDIDHCLADEEGKAQVVGDLDGGVGDFDQKQMVKGAGEGLDLEAWQFGEPSTWSESTPVARSWANLPKWPQFVAVQVILFHLT